MLHRQLNYQHEAIPELNRPEQSERNSQAPLTPERAVLIGQLVVNLPVTCIVCVGVILGFLLGGLVWAALGLLLAVIPAWLWWALSVPLWREWAKQSGADEDKTQQLAVWTALVWPKGWFFEKTEIHLRKKK